MNARELSRNQSIVRFDVIHVLQHDWSIEQRLLHIGFFFGGKTKRPCFDPFIHWLIKQTPNTCRDYFSRSYENRSNANYASLFAVELERLLANNNIRASCQTNITLRHYSKRCKQQKWTLKIVRLTSFQKPESQSVSIFFKFSPSVTSFVLVGLFIPSFNVIFYVSLSLVAGLTVWILINFMTPTQLGRRNIMISKKLTRE